MLSQQIKNIKWLDASRKYIVVSGNVLLDFHSFPLSFAPLTDNVVMHFSMCDLQSTLTAAETHSTVLVYQRRDFTQCVHWTLLLAIKVPVFCRKSVMVSKMLQPQKPMG